jgi:hypothetical protein
VERVVCGGRVRERLWVPRNPERPPVGMEAGEGRLCLVHRVCRLRGSNVWKGGEEKRASLL